MDQDATWYYIVLGGDTAPLQEKGGTAAPFHFRPMSIVAKSAGWIKVPLRMEVGIGEATLCHMGTQPPFPERGTAAHSSPLFGPCLL